MIQEWYFFIDIVGSSNPNIKLNTQIEKIKKLVQIIKDFLLTHPESYKSFIFLTLLPLEQFRNLSGHFFSYKELICNELNNIFRLE